MNSSSEFISPHYYDEDFLLKHIAGDSAPALVALRYSLESMNNFSPSNLNYSVWEELVEQIRQYRSGQAIDFDSQADQAILERLSDPTQYSGCPELQSDSWIPSVRSPNEITCKVAGSNADDTDCPDAATIIGSTGTCMGCMDSFKILQIISTDIVGHLQNRYSTVAGCVSWS